MTLMASSSSSAEVGGVTVCASREPPWEGFGIEGDEMVGEEALGDVGAVAEDEESEECGAFAELDKVLLTSLALLSAGGGMDGKEALCRAAGRIGAPDRYDWTDEIEASAVGRLCVW